MPIRRPKLHIRTLMVVVAVVGITISISIEVDPWQWRRTNCINWATWHDVRVVASSQSAEYYTALAIGHFYVSDEMKAREFLDIAQSFVERAEWHGRKRDEYLRAADRPWLGMPSRQ